MLQTTANMPDGKTGLKKAISLVEKITGSNLLFTNFR